MHTYLFVYLLGGGPTSLSSQQLSWLYVKLKREMIKQPAEDGRGARPRWGEQRSSRLSPPMFQRISEGAHVHGEANGGAGKHDAVDCHSEAQGLARQWQPSWPCGAPCYIRWRLGSKDVPLLFKKKQMNQLMLFYALFSSC